MAAKNRIRNYLLLGIGAVLAIAFVVLVCVLAVKHFLPNPTEGKDNPSLKELTCLQFSSYTGEFVEDGSHDSVQDVAAILVENPGTEFLDRAVVTYHVGSKTAEFVITGLPPGKRAWVLESNRMVLEVGDTFRLADSSTSFRSDAVLETEGLRVTSDGINVTVTNDTKKPMENVCIYYKNRHSDGNYLGGITYMLTFETLQPGETVSKASAHFGAKSEIVRYGYQTGS